MSEKDRILNAAIAHVAFDGWSEATFKAAIEDTGLDPVDARAHFPRGAIDLAVAYHKAGDARMIERAEEQDIGALRYSEKVERLVELRIEVSDKEVVRKGMSIFALPQNSVEGGRLMWETADAIWNFLVDTSEDYNWYSKRLILSGVISSTVLFWLGDASEGGKDTRAFLARRIGDVMKFEKFKADLRKSKTLRPLIGIPEALLKPLKAPSSTYRDDLPGRWPGSKG